MYRALYRKYRPSTFSDVVGQNHITQTLMNAVSAGKTSHAYLFTGSRGTGKTSCAKILAKAVNCEHPVNGNPCNECDICKGIDNGSILDVVEIDAASNNSVDNIRDLREEANFTPANAKYRVYIIDEVHMLSVGAFNSLLKTLEEPPEHVKFILATTEVHKLPSTILSRCQRFDFKRIPPESIAERLKEVAEKENMQLSDDGAMLIARIADGAMRDALSLLDRCVSHEGVIDSSVVAKNSGLAGREYIFELADCVFQKNAAKALEIINSLYNDSCDMERLIIELTNHFRNLMISKAVKDFSKMLICSQNEIEIIRRQSGETTLAVIMSCIDVLTSSAADMKQGANRRTVAELCIIRLCTPSLDTDINSLIRRISELEKAVANGISVAPRREIISTPSAEPVSVPKPIEIKKEPEITEKAEPVQAMTPKTEEKKAVPQPEPPKAERDEPALSNAGATVPFSKWPEVTEKLFAENKSLIAMLTGSSAYIFDNKYLLIKGSPVLELYLKTGEYSKIIKQAVFDITGKSYSLGVYNNAPREENKNPLSDLVSRAKQLGIKVEGENQ